MFFKKSLFFFKIKFLQRNESQLNGVVNAKPSSSSTTPRSHPSTVASSMDSSTANTLTTSQISNASSLGTTASGGATSGGSCGPTKLRDSIHLAACSSNELLPMQTPELPYDLFTACLTTPIKAALHWYISQKLNHSTGSQAKQLVPGLTLELLERIPGQINDRRTMMGELNWIFTAITDTIAWNVLDSDLFQVSGGIFFNSPRFFSS